VSLSGWPSSSGFFFPFLRSIGPGLARSFFSRRDIFFIFSIISEKFSAATVELEGLSGPLHLPLLRTVIVSWVLLVGPFSFKKNKVSGRFFPLFAVVRSTPAFPRVWWFFSEFQA